MIIAILIHVAALAMIAGGAWLTLAGSVAAVFPEALALDVVLAGYPAVLIARYTRQVALLFVVIGLLLFTAGATLGARGLA